MAYTERDVIVVGAGPAGSSCAAELRRLGYSVLILDKSSFPRDKLCAGWVPPSLFRLLGVDPADYPHSLREYRRLHFRIKGFPISVPTRQYALRRYEFDYWLLQRCGVEWEEHRVRGIKADAQGYVIDEKYRAAYLIGAGGTACPIGRFLRTRLRAGERGRGNTLIVTMEEEFPYDVADENCYLRFFDNGLHGYCWYFPKENGYLTVGVGGSLSVLKSKGQSIRDHWRAFTERLTTRGLVDGYLFAPKGHGYYLRGGGSLCGDGDRIYLVGDSARLATTDMGEGIEPAVRSGYLAARAIAEGKSYSCASVKQRSLPDILRPGASLAGPLYR